MASNAQSLELSDVGRSGFKGVNKMGNTGYFIQYEEGVGNSRNIRVIVLSNDLVKEADFQVPLKNGEKLDDIAYANGNFLIATSFPMHKTKNYLLYDKLGNKITNKELTGLNARVFDQPTTIVATNNDFIVVSMFRDKKVGYSLERFSSNLEPKYTETYVPEKKKLYPVDYAVAGDILYILEFYARDMNDNFEYHIAGFNIETGKQLFNNYLKSADEKSYGYATFLRLTEKGDAVTGGMYFNNDHEEDANSDGFFSALIGKDGVMKYEYQSWKEVAETLKDKNTSAMWGGKTKTLMHDIAINKDGSFTLIGENFRKGDENLAGGKNMGLGIATKVSNDGPSDLAVTVSEFTLFDFTQDNKFKGVRKIEKPFSVTIIRSSTEPNNEPYGYQFRGLNLANTLNNKGYFPYRLTADKDGEKVLVYQVNYDKKYLEKLYFTPLNATKTDTVSIEITNSLLKADQELNAKVQKKGGKLAALSAKMDKFNGTDIQNTVTIHRSDDASHYRSRLGHIRVLPSNINGKVLLFDFVPELTGDDNQKKNMLDQYTASKDAAVKAKLKVWYVDVPVSK
jgi:hypothetical protein